MAQPPRKPKPKNPKFLDIPAKNKPKAPQAANLTPPNATGVKPVPTPGLPRPKPTKRPSNSGMPVKPVPTPGVPRKPKKKNGSGGVSAGSGKNGLYW